MNLIISAFVVTLVLTLYKFTKLLQKLPKPMNLTLVFGLLVFALYNFTLGNKLYNTSGSTETMVLNFVLGLLLFVTAVKLMSLNDE